MRVAMAAAVALFVLSSLPNEAAAQRRQPGVSYKDYMEGKRLFYQGNLAYNDGNYEEAIVRWEKSFELSKEPLMFFNIAKAYEGLNQLDKAVDYLKRWREKAPVREHNSLDRKIATLEARLEQQREEERKLKEEQDRLRREEEERKRQEEEKKRREEERKRQEADAGGVVIAGAVVTGVGAAAVVAGAIMGGVAAGQRPDEAEACAQLGDQLLCSASMSADIENSNTLAVAGDVTWISGAVLAATGVVIMVALRPKSEPAAEEAPSDEPVSDAALAPLVLPGGGGASLRLRF